MKKLFQKLIAILQMDVGKESESNNEAILIRLMCTLGIVHYLLTAIALAFNQNIILCLILIFSIGIYVGALICTYEDRTPLASALYILQTLFVTAVLSLSIGWKYFFAPMAIVVLMVLYFSLNMSLKKKALFSVCMAIYLFAISVGYFYLPRHTEIFNGVALLVLFLNISLSVSSISIVGYCFCRKFSQTEEKILQYNKKLEQMASTDSLTALWNRRAMNDHLIHLVTQHNRYQCDFSIAIMDIDFFKHVNDEYGHGMGDFVLKTLSAVLSDHMTDLGHVCRWGGEEFLLSFENMDYDAACHHMELLRQKIENQEFTYKKTSIHITITGGITEYTGNTSLDSLITRADELLYKGKTSGRNKIVCSYY